MSQTPLTPLLPDEPAYLSVKNWIKTHISSGNWRPGDTVPSEHALSRQFGLSRQTINRALRELAAEGLVDRQQGSGTVVAALHRVAATLRMRDLFEEITERGHVPSSRVLLLAAEKAAANLAHSLKIRTGSKVFHSKMVFLESGVPIQFEDRFVNPAAAPDYLLQDFSQSSPTRYLLAQAPLTEASYDLQACLPTANEAQVLGINHKEPCLCMARRTVSGPHVASVTRQLYPGSRYSFQGQFQV